MIGVQNKTPRVLRHLIEDSLDLELLKVQLIPNGALIHCGDLNIQNQVLTLGGHSLDNHIIKCSRVDHALSTEELADFITGRLQTDQKLQTMRQSWDTPIKTSQVQTIGQVSHNGTSSPSNYNTMTEKHHPALERRTPSPSTLSPGKGPHSPKGKGKGKSRYIGKPNYSATGRGQSGAIDNSQQRGYCGFCQYEGRPSNHQPHLCNEWKAYLKTTRPPICLTCQGENKPANHLYKTCPNFMNKRAPHKPHTSLFQRNMPPTTSNYTSSSHQQQSSTTNDTPPEIDLLPPTLHPPDPVHNHQSLPPTRAVRALWEQALAHPGSLPLYLQHTHPLSKFTIIGIH